MDNDEEVLELRDRVKELEVLVELNNEAIKELKATIEITNQSIISIQMQLSKYSGAWGLLLMVVSGVWAGLTMFKDSIFGERA